MANDVASHFACFPIFSTTYSFHYHSTLSCYTTFKKRKMGGDFCFHSRSIYTWSLCSCCYHRVSFLRGRLWTCFGPLSFTIFSFHFFLSSYLYPFLVCYTKDTRAGCCCRCHCFGSKEKKEGHTYTEPFGSPFTHVP